MVALSLGSRPLVASLGLGSETIIPQESSRYNWTLSDGFQPQKILVVFPSECYSTAMFTEVVLPQSGIPVDLRAMLAENPDFSLKPCSEMENKMTEQESEVIGSAGLQLLQK